MRWKRREDSWSSRRDYLLKRRRWHCHVLSSVLTSVIQIITSNGSLSQVSSLDKPCLKLWVNVHARRSQPLTSTAFATTGRHGCTSAMRVTVNLSKRSLDIIWVRRPGIASDNGGCPLRIRSCTGTVSGPNAGISPLTAEIRKRGCRGTEEERV